ncbi:hypothetical protein BKA93DRAFT_737019 [Sparassis latifolia]
MWPFFRARLPASPRANIPTSPIWTCSHLGWRNRTRERGTGALTRWDTSYSSSRVLIFGKDYLLVADVLGPGSPSPSTSEPAQPVAPPANANARPASPFVGRVEEERRRVLKNGTVKVKFSLLGVVVDKCGICLSQFRVEELAVLGATCQHAFHERCLRRWLATSRTCPICRIAISLAEYDALSSRR